MMQQAVAPATPVMPCGGLAARQQQEAVRAAEEGLKSGSLEHASGRVGAPAIADEHGDETERLQNEVMAGVSSVEDALEPVSELASCRRRRTEPLCDVGAAVYSTQATLPPPPGSGGGVGQGT